VQALIVAKKRAVVGVYNLTEPAIQDFVLVWKRIAGEKSA
jgi:hypothetical protein